MDHVAWYYDQNTPRFLRFGGSGEAAAIHRQIWAPGVEDAEAAFLYLNRLVAEAIEPALIPIPSQARLLDLGCGVGGTTTWLADQLKTQVTGVTNSPVQHRLATERASRLGLGARCHFILADFMDLPQIGPFNAAFAIESFIHAPDGARFFQMVFNHLIDAGRLILCDDFLSDDPLSPRAMKWVARYRKGWHVPNLLPLSEVKSLAADAGFRLLQATDLTPYLRPFSPPLLGLMKLVTLLPLRSAYWHNLSGGTALQVCSQNGWTGYHALLWEKSA